VELVSNKTWVLAWKPFDPNGLFVHKIGNLNDKDNGIVARSKVSEAMRLTKGEAMFLLQTIKGHADFNTFSESLMMVNLEDHEI
jgi:hypothetical protein